MIALTWAQARYTGIKPDEAEEFTSASRSVKPGLIASAVVSAWTWAATLVRYIFHGHTTSLPSLCALYAMAAYLTSYIQLQSSAVAYRYGISGPYWYASGATIQVLLFAQVCFDCSRLFKR
jgi:Na+/proline symporter